MAGWIGRDLERLRKLRGLRREDVAAQLSLSPSTIRNIEHDERYNVSLDLLRQVAELLGGTIRISLEVPEAGEGPAGTEATGPELVAAGAVSLALAAGDAGSGGGPASAEPGSAASARTVSVAGPDARRVVTNDQFIRLIRERYPDCPLTNSQIGRRMWQFAQSRGAELMKGRKQLRRTTAPAVAYRVPTTSAEFAVKERDVVALERFADRLGRAFRDSKGRVLVPIR